VKPESKDPLVRLQERWNAFYGALDGPRRRRLWAGLSLICLVAGLVALIAGRTHWVTLYSGLEARDAGAITDKLKAAKVPYRIAGDGTQIEVPDTAVYEQRLSLAAQGLPQGQGRGYELLDENNLLLSEESARVNRLRALQGELERSILSMRGVEGVRVHLVVPEQRLFAKDGQPSSASVLLKLQPGVQLEDSEAAALAHLVSHAVEGLKPESVAIVDTEGHDLGPGAAGAGAQVGSHIDAARRVEKHVADQLQSLFDEALGPGQAIVRVHAELDFSDQAVQRETYTPAAGRQGLVREEQLSSSTDSGPAQGQGVVAGNGGESVAGPPSHGATRSDRRVTYELNHTVENITQGAGTLKRLSVSVLLKQAVGPEELAALKDAVGKTAGLDPARGDAMGLAVLSDKAAAAPQAAALAGEQAKALTDEALQQRRLMLVSAAAPWAAAALGMLVFGILAWRALRLSAPPKAGSLPAAQAAAAAQAPALSTDADLQQLVEHYPSSAAEVLRRMMTN